MILPSAEETEALGRRIGGRALPGTVIALVGDLGAGKSVLARGIARGLGIGGRIPSPTFVLVAEYTDGRLPFHHLDLYRLSDVEELEQLGLDEVFGGAGVVAVEWPRRAPELFEGAVWIELTEIPGPDEARRASVTGPADVVEHLLG